MQHTVLVIGSGIAGLTYALKAAEFSRVILVTKKDRSESNTNYAQGGIAAVMAPDDSPDLHVKDTEQAGSGLCHRDAVERMVREGPERVRELVAWGARFHRAESASTGEFDLGREGGHSRNRIVHARDLTGREVERTLIAAVQAHARIELHQHRDAAAILCSSGPNREAAGALVLDTATGQLEPLRADATVLATGGAGQVYRHTTNPGIATGDGVAMAYRAGARVGNMEFIQFHPTTLFHPEAKSFLISEAVRGEGGVLRRRDGTTFMDEYHPLASLAPRDVVARAIDAELKKGGDDHVFLDVTHLDPDFVRDRFPAIYQRCLQFGIDITRQMIPIVPAAHYSCGGVMTDLSARTSLHRLYAIGEVACTGVHGANRLASNSLLEALVFADHAARDTQRLLREEGRAGAPEDSREWLRVSHPDRQTGEVSTEFISQLRLLVQTLMWNHAGIVRSDRRLREAERELEILRPAVDRLVETAHLSVDLLELRNITLVAQLIIRCCLLRKESRGLHYNIDHPNRDDEAWRHDTVL